MTMMVTLATMEDPLKQEKAYLKAHVTELAERYPGKYLIIKGEAVHGAFETYEQAVIEGVTLFGAGPILVRSVLQPDDVPLDLPPALAPGILSGVRSRFACSGSEQG